MGRIDSIMAKIEQMENLLAEVKSELETLKKEKEDLIQSGEARKSRKLYRVEPLPAEEELRAEYERLYDEFKNKNFNAIEEFVKGKSKRYLKTFCKANNLPVDTTKVSKDGIAKEVLQWFAQRNAITRKVT